MFCTIPASSLDGAYYVVRFLFRMVVFLPCGHRLDVLQHRPIESIYDIQPIKMLQYSSIQQVAAQWRNTSKLSGGRGDNILESRRNSY